LRLNCYLAAASNSLVMAIFLSTKADMLTIPPSLVFSNWAIEVSNTLYRFASCPGLSCSTPCRRMGTGWRPPPSG
jgi:hypothetical protein